MKEAASKRKRWKGIEEDTQYFILASISTERVIYTHTHTFSVLEVEKSKIKIVAENTLLAFRWMLSFCISFSESERKGERGETENILVPPISMDVHPIAGPHSPESMQTQLSPKDAPLSIITL